MSFAIAWVLPIIFLSTVGSLFFVANGQASTSEPEIVMHEEDCTLSFSVKNKPLKVVLEAISAEANIDISVFGNLDDVVSDHFVQIPLDQAIKRVLRKQNFAMIYETGKAKLAARCLKEVRIYAARSSQPSAGLSPGAISGERRKSTDAAEKISNRALNEEAEARRRGLVLAARTGGAEALTALERALDDDEPSVRLQAIRGLYRVGRENAVTALSRVATGDDNVEVRLAAVELLAQINNPESIFALEQAEHDPDPKIRHTARLSLVAMQGRPVTD